MEKIAKEFDIIVSNPPTYLRNPIPLHSAKSCLMGKEVRSESLGHK